MTMREEVLKVMSDGEPRTARQIALEIHPEASIYQMEGLKTQVREALIICEKWREMERVGTTKEGNPAVLWKAIA